MKFGEAFTEYLKGEQDRFLEKCCHVEYKNLKNVLKTCQTCKASPDSCSPDCQCQSCPLCDQKFFSELMKEASQIAGCFSSRVRHLLHLHVATGMQRYVMRLRHCFKNDQQAMVLEGWMLIEYATMNALAIRKILKKYDKIHSSVNGRNFKSKLLAEHVELLQSPWLIELGAFELNFNGSDDGDFNEFSSQFSCDFNVASPVMTLMLPHTIKLEFDLTCAICLEVVFNPYALSCGHLFCKSCACSAASVFIFQGLRAASRESKCPTCREVGVYAKAVHMLELDMLLKNRCKDYWKERLAAERAEMVKQSKHYWDSQAKYAIGMF
ncbi:probable E3 ubiquitin-protein ligase BAH1-like isoform X1 [Fagus crenata]|uniref:RING-type E3 ubiquitin transferase n=1 Tax=Fagus sylvatica TaxID=28930 RepID=A0A2N9GB48_FAGSY